MIINAHAHIYPEKIAEKATGAIGSFYDIPMAKPSGTAERLLEDGKRAGIDMFLVHSCATKAEQVCHINDFILKEMELHPEFIGFMTLHPDMAGEDIYNEVTRCVNAGMKGIKIHPDFQRFYLDEERAEKIYRGAADRLPFLVHTGDNRYEYSKPRRMAKVAKAFPKTFYIAAHFGGYRCWDDVGVYKGLDNMRFDTCSALAFIDKNKAKSIIDALGAENFLFGTDFPMWDGVEEIERFMKVPLTDAEREEIFAGNAKRLLNL